MAKKTLDDLGEILGRRVLVRVDFNVPLDSDGNITSDRRIQAALPTLRRVLDAGGCAIVMSHLGRPKGDPKKDAAFGMGRVAARLADLVGRPVHLAPGITGPAVEAAARALKPGEVLLLENLRFDPREQAGDAGFARELASLGDAYVNDAFGTCHRLDASMVALPRAMAGKPRVVGLLVARELEVLGQLLESPRRPLLAILGGAKVSDKIGFLKSLLERVDRVLIGGAMTYTFMKAQGSGIGHSKVESDKLDVAREFLTLGRGRVELPTDHLVVARLDDPATARVVDGDIPGDLIGVDIGPRTIGHYWDEIAKAGMVVWNGPMGKYEDEPYSRGTRAVAEALAKSRAVSIVGGGETAEAVEKFGMAPRMTHVSTGGGAFLEYVEGTPFPALAEVDER